MEVAQRERVLKENPHLLRIGIRVRYINPVKIDFATLLSRFTSRYANAQPDLLRALGDPKLIDACALLNFKDDVGKFNTICGPMARDQSKNMYFPHAAKNQLPEVGIYYDVDYFRKPDQEMKWAAVIQAIEQLSNTCWERFQSVQHLLTNEGGIVQKSQTGSVPSILSQTGIGETTIAR